MEINKDNVAQPQGQPQGETGSMTPEQLLNAYNAERTPPPPEGQTGEPEAPSAPPEWWETAKDSFKDYGIDSFDGLSKTIESARNVDALQRQLEQYKAAAERPAGSDPVQIEYSNELAALIDQEFRNGASQAEIETMMKVYSVDPGKLDDIDAVRAWERIANPKASIAEIDAYLENRYDGLLDGQMDQATSYEFKRFAEDSRKNLGGMKGELTKKVKAGPKVIQPQAQENAELFARWGKVTQDAILADGKVDMSNIHPDLPPLEISTAERAEIRKQAQQMATQAGWTLTVDNLKQIEQFAKLSAIASNYEAYLKSAIEAVTKKVKEQSAIQQHNVPPRGGVHRQLAPKQPVGKMQHKAGGGI